MATEEITLTAPPRARRAALGRRWRVLAGWAGIGAGAIVLFAGWFGVSGETEVAKQLPYLISGGLGGLAAVGVGVALLVSEDLRADRVRLGRLEAELLEVRDLLRSIAEPGGSLSRGPRGPAS